MTKPTKVRPTVERIKTVANFLPDLEAIGPGHLARTIRTPEGDIVLGCVEYHPAVHKFEKACYENGFIQTFDWSAWAPTARRFMRNPELIASARLSTCIKLITAHIRCERLCDGHLQEVFSSGHISAILRRLLQLAERSSG